jgi:SAM-dependent methyltransferase
LKPFFLNFKKQIMNTIDRIIENQYDVPQLYEDIVQRLRAQGIDTDHISRVHLEGVDEFHLRGAAVSAELVRQLDFTGKRVLDAGCGLGGPCRMLADEFGCRVTGIDMSPEFIRTAQKLTELVGLQDQADFRVGNALDLPFADNSFDIVWTQHVQMNIEDKLSFYAEACRVLKPGGHLVYYDIFKRPGKDVTYPVPWADSPDISHLQTIGHKDDILDRLPFERISIADHTEKAREFLVNALDNIEKQGPPAIGLNILLGEATLRKLGNVLDALENGKIELQSGIYMKGRRP